ncbi:hypothetical protein [Mangrovibacter plantisponsor]|uniref:Uncharacterized protein n=1 Tax=Mangrovibacter plantisponsor TaxID=451513 RepID=A0A317PJC6_9ENTR|nr:hypothetical protein [Mangrovibacter plantisponsor]PWV99573.1 hypothetical protein DES37_1284 [Mangrovibacter plantisponsor]
MSEVTWLDVATTRNYEQSEEKSKTSFFFHKPLINQSKQPAEIITLENNSETCIEKVKKYSKSMQNAIIETNIAGIALIQPDTPIKKKNEHSSWKKSLARKKEKTVSLHKILDAYGIIDEITKKDKSYEIRARIYDIENHEMIDDIVFSSLEFTKSDQQKIVENAIFYWHVGKERTIFGQERRVSEFRLRRVFNPISL